MDHTINEHVVNFLTRKESPEDIQKLKEWLAADPAHRDELRQWLAMWDAAGMADAGKLHPDEAYQRFMFRLQREASKKKAGEPGRAKNISGVIRRIAAIFIVSFSLGMLCHHSLTKSRPEQAAFVENIVPLGSKSEIKLPDGTVVWLNAGSTLRYSFDYGRAATRDVYLVGEGYFKVAKQTNSPFIVHTALMRVKALGTEFNVKAYPEEGRTETTLVSGKVMIDKEDENTPIDAPVILEPGQKFSVRALPEVKSGETKQTQAEQYARDEETRQRQHIVEQLSTATVHAEVSWKERNWRIESEPLQELAVMLDRRYNVHITMDEQLRNYRFTGTIKDESLEQVLHAMQLTAPILFKVEGKAVFIRVDPRKLN